MRLIDADALKEELRSWLALPNRDNDARDVVLHLIAVIDNAPTFELRMGRMTNGIIIPIEKPQGEWIPVSERLPKQNGFYITTCRDICENRVHVVGFDGVRKKWGRGGVIAWQPLPEPYKKGGVE